MALARLASKRLLVSRCTGGLTRAFTSSCLRREDKRNIIDTLSSRSLLAQVTAPNSLRSHLNGQEQRSVYVGVDPSAESLHVGNLLPLLAALHFLQHGHRVVVVIGGATGSIGDPSGRNTERSFLSPSELAHNVAKITEQVHGFFAKASDFLQRHGNVVSHAIPVSASKVESTPMQEAAKAITIQEAEVASERAINATVSAPGSQPFSGLLDGGTPSDTPLNVTVVNNEEWYKSMNVLSFLRDVGKLARVGTMLARDSVKSRLQPSASEISSDSSSQDPVGLSYTEFSYQLLQAYDFSVLHGAPWNCTVQLGGSDQMGNIMAGVDLIRRQKVQQERSEEEVANDTIPAYGLTLPLLTTASGAKFGKSAGNAVWLSSEKCSDYDFYQFFLRSRDQEVELYLKTLTMLSLEMIESIVRAHQQDPSSRRGQKILASEVIELVRGRKALARAQAASRVLFETQLEGLRAGEVLEAFKIDPRLKTMARPDCLGVELARLAVQVGLSKSRNEAKRAMTSGGFYLNNVAIRDTNRILEEEDLVCDGKIVVLRIGRTEHRIVYLG
jgi:tyrosyl-tRNA synthetase